MTVDAVRELSFPAGGQRCVGRLSLPSEFSGELPCVVMAHGTTGTMDFGLTRYARRFTDAGFAVVAFDYRHFGRSGGQPRVGEPGGVAVFTGAQDYAVAMALAADAPEWRNEMAARSLFSLIGYRPGTRAGRLRMPLLVCVAEDDTAASLPLAVRAAEEAPRGQLCRYPGGHFSAYVGDVFERMVTDEVAFLRQHLAPVPARTERA